MKRTVFIAFLLLSQFVLSAPAVSATDMPIESDSMGIMVFPTLLLTGSLESTPPIAANCEPFTFYFQVRNAGNVSPTNGALKVEIWYTDPKQLASAQQLPFSLKASANTTEKLDVPRGAYTVTFCASAPWISRTTPSPDFSSLRSKARPIPRRSSRSGERMRALAEALDFRFGSPLSGNSMSITLPADSGLGLTGTMPMSGRFLPPRKRGARAAAMLPDGQPAILYDVQDKGKVIIMPLSMVQSALNAGTMDLYSLLLRSSVLTASPELEAPGSIASMQLLVLSTIDGQEKTRIAETLPQGAKVLWTSIPPSTKDGTLTFELFTEREAKKYSTCSRRRSPAERRPRPRCSWSAEARS